MNTLKQHQWMWEVLLILSVVSKFVCFCFFLSVSFFCFFLLPLYVCMWPSSCVTREKNSTWVQLEYRSKNQHFRKKKHIERILSDKLEKLYRLIILYPKCLKPEVFFFLGKINTDITYCMWNAAIFVSVYSFIVHFNNVLIHFVSVL